MTSQQPDAWIEVVARVASVDSEPVADALRDLGASGAVIEPALHIDDRANFAYDEVHDKPWTVRAYFPAPMPDRERRIIRRRLASLPLSAALERLVYTEVRPEDWAETWRQFYHVQHIGRRLVVRPTWEAYEPQGDEVVVALDPGAAFGTGQHETTRLCLAASERHVEPGSIVLDVGAGSGILAIAALQLGAAQALAIDDDPGTVAVAEENAAGNGVSDRMLVAAGSLGAAWPWPDRPPRALADLVLANISSTAVVELMPALAAALRPDGLLVASGFIARDAGTVRDAASEAGLAELAVDAEGDWRCLLARQSG